MTKLRAESAPRAVTAAAEIHAGRLKAHKKTIHLAPSIEDLLDKHKAADAHHHQKELERILLTGKLTYADGELDDLVLGASHKVLDVTGRERDDARFEAAFPTSAAEGTKGMADSAQDSFVANVVHVLRTTPDFAHLIPQADAIEAAQAEVTALRQQREAAYNAEAIALAALNIAQSRLVDAIQSNRSRLDLIFPKQRKRVSSFY